MSAIISDCGTYRYRLERETERSGPAVAFIGVNPSTADASADDATIRKMRGFAQRWGYSRFIVGNLFAFRATDVKALRSAYGAPVDRRQQFALESAHLFSILSDAHLIVPCWGNIRKVPKQLRPRIAEVLDLLTLAEKPTVCLGTTENGDPRHPLMLGYATELVTWRGYP